jgi:hypothetical protein
MERPRGQSSAGRVASLVCVPACNSRGTPAVSLPLALVEVASPRSESEVRRQPARERARANERTATRRVSYPAAPYLLCDTTLVDERARCRCAPGAQPQSATSERSLGKKTLSVERVSSNQQN